MSEQSISDTFREQLGAIENIATKATIVLVGIIVVFAVGVEIHTCFLCVGTRPSTAPDAEPFRLLLVLGVSAAVAIAAAISGAFLGFLFGIPRLLSRDGRLQSRIQSLGGEAPNDERKSVGRAAILSNSNLEEISDWLTKIIVGVALIQIKEIYDAVMGSVWFFERALPGTPAAGEFLLLLATASSVGSFLFSYMETRTRIALLLAAIELGRDSLMGETSGFKEPIITAAEPLASAPSPLADEAAHRPLSTLDLVTPKAAPTPEDARVLEYSFDELDRPEEYAAWGAAQARSGNYPEAILALKRAIAKKPKDVDMYRRLAEAQFKFGDYTGAAETLVEARRLAPQNYDLTKLLLPTLLWQDSPAAIEQALKLIDEFQDKPIAKNDPWFHVWHAATQGQKYWHLIRSTHATDSAKKEVEGKALKAVEAAIALSPDTESLPRRVLRGMLRPGHGGLDEYDDDLHVFEKNETFTKKIF